MTERWRKPAEVVGEIEPDPNKAIQLVDGRIQREPMIPFSAETVDRLRSGWLCMKCVEPFERAWPIKCPVCGAPVRTEQARYFAMRYAGEIRIGPHTTLEEERAGIAERARKEEEQ